MKLIEDIFESVRPKFEKGGPWEKLFPLYEATDSFFLSSAEVTGRGPHVRDALDLKRLMSVVVLAILPCFFFGTYNVGLQSLRAAGVADPGFWLCVLTGAKAVLPIVAVSYAVGGAWEVLFALVRKHEINEGFLVTGLLFPLTLPPTIPLWMVAAGVSFGVILGKEVFGGTGMNILNPALTARAFVFFAYPAKISGDDVWILAQDKAVDGFSGATPLAVAAASGSDSIGAIREAGFAFRDTLIGTIPGSIGETSSIAILIGAVILIASGIGSWRIMASCVAGAVATSWLMQAAAGPGSAGIMSLPALQHITLGGFLFGTVYMATDPVSAAQTRSGEWIYGIGIGAIAVLVRCVNPAYPEGMMLAILFMNVIAPVIDYGTIQLHFKRRAARRPAGG